MIDPLLPAVSGLAGIFFPGGPMPIPGPPPTIRAAVIIDYQNVHMTAHEVFDRHSPKHQSLIHPMQFAKRVLVQRNSRQGAGYAKAELAYVKVFRGLPHSDYEWEANRRNLDQKTSWENAGAHVEYRDLRYEFQRGADGRPIKDVNGKKIPTGKPQEKGIDVLCALEALRQAEDPGIGLVILATHDTDLVPVLDDLYDRRGREPERFARIETVSWYNKAARKTGEKAGSQIRATSPRTVWNTNLDRSCFDASIDRNDYR